MRNQPVTRIMTSAPACVAPETPLSRARQLMAKHAVHHLPVVAGGKLVGMLSAADLLHEAAGGVVADRMQAGAVSVPSTATLHDAAAALGAGMFHGLPVVDAAGAPVGIVTSTDLVRALLEQVTPADPQRAESHGIPPDAAERFADPAALAAAVNAASARHAAGDDPQSIAAAALYLAARVKALDAVLHAAQLYLHSGQGEHEHRDLVRSVQRAKEEKGSGLAVGRM